MITRASSDSRPAPTPPPTAAVLQERLVTWFDGAARDLPWRGDGVSAWGVLVSEVMLQQTPVVRVEPAWRRWMEAWPTPAHLAAASPQDVLRAWDRLGYPRRALRLRDCAIAVVERHDGVVPHSEADLLALPGVGEYTAAAVRAFAYGLRAVVLDTNVRRVLDRVVSGAALPSPSITRAERATAVALLPAGDAASARWNIALMELGALVCQARTPRCEECPVNDLCAWRAAGQPGDRHAARRRTQAWEGTDRQARGAVMAVLRAADAPTAAAELDAVVPDTAQRGRVLAGLVADGLASLEHGSYRIGT